MKDWMINLFYDNIGEEYVANVVGFKNISGLGDTAEEALAELQTAWELYLEELKEGGKSLPEAHFKKKYSGNLRLRIGSSLHQSIARKAVENGVSMNKYVTQILAENV